MAAKAPENLFALSLLLPIFALAQAPALQSKLCDDLFEAACRQPGGKPEFERGSKYESGEIVEPIWKARDKTAQLMGFKDFDDALKAKLKETGLELREPVDAEAFKLLKRPGGFFGGGGDNARKLYVSVDQCLKDY